MEITVPYRKCMEYGRLLEDWFQLDVEAFPSNHLLLRLMLSFPFSILQTLQEVCHTFLNAFHCVWARSPVLVKNWTLILFVRRSTIQVWWPSWRSFKRSIKLWLVAWRCGNWPAKMMMKLKVSVKTSLFGPRSQWYVDMDLIVQPYCILVRVNRSKQQLTLYLCAFTITFVSNGCSYDHAGQGCDSVVNVKVNILPLVLAITNWQCMRESQVGMFCAHRNIATRGHWGSWVMPPLSLDQMPPKMKWARVKWWAGRGEFPPLQWRIQV